MAIAGHRTTYGKPFANLDRLKVGDEIFLETPVGKYTYKVSKDPFVMHPDRLQRHRPDARQDADADDLPPEGVGPPAPGHQGRVGLPDGQPARPRADAPPPGRGGPRRPRPLPDRPAGVGPPRHGRAPFRLGGESQPLHRQRRGPGVLQRRGRGRLRRVHRRREELGRRDPPGQRRRPLDLPRGHRPAERRQVPAEDLHQLRLGHDPGDEPHAPGLDPRRRCPAGRVLPHLAVTGSRPVGQRQVHGRDHRLQQRAGLQLRPDQRLQEAAGRAPLPLPERLGPGPVAGSVGRQRRERPRPG